MINFLEENQVFVFGSNVEGRHGRGAAKQALKFGAQYGVSSGHVGQTYAIVTKDLRKGYTVGLGKIERQLIVLKRYAELCPELEFLLTPVGTGLAGFSLETLESILPEMPDNVILLWRQS